jgi:hypothetical protein
MACLKKVKTGRGPALFNAPEAFEIVVRAHLFRKNI